MFTKEFWRAATERAVKTAAQVAILFILAGKAIEETTPVNAFELDWKGVVGVALGGAFLSYLFSLASGLVGQKGTPSLTKAEVLATPTLPVN